MLNRRVGRYGRLHCCWVAAGISVLVSAQTTRAQNPSPTSNSPSRSSRAAAPWLSKAREAEALLMQEDGVRQALAAYERLEKEIPNQPPLILRCAQLADQMDDSALALFHYRRYLAITGERARQEARDRAATMELNAEAKQGADRLARDRKVSAAPVQTPAVRRGGAILAALGADGTKLVEIRSDQDFTSLQDPAKQSQLAAQATVAPQATATTPADDALVRSFAARTASAPTQVQIQTPAGQRPTLNRVTVREGDYRRDPAPAESAGNTVDAPPVDSQAQPGLAPLLDDSNNPAQSQPYAGNLPQAGSENWNRSQPPAAYQAPAFPEGPSRRFANTGTRRGPSGAMVSDVGAPQGRLPLPRTASTAGTRQDPRSLSAGPDQNPMPVAPRNGEFSNVPPTSDSEPRADTATPGPSMGAPMDPRQRFFTSRASSDGKTRLKLSNSLPETIMTFAALSEGSATKADAILANGETRIIEISPSAFDIRLTVMSIGYPPATLTDRRFRMRFNAGTEYSVRLSTDIMQRLN